MAWIIFNWMDLWNCSVCGSENPRTFVEQCLYPQIVTVLVRLLDRRCDWSVTDNTKHYCTISTDFPWFAQDEMSVALRTKWAFKLLHYCPKTFYDGLFHEKETLNDRLDSAIQHFLTLFLWALVKGTRQKCTNISSASS